MEVHNFYFFFPICLLATRGPSPLHTGPLTLPCMLLGRPLTLTSFLSPCRRTRQTADEVTPSVRPSSPCCSSSCSCCTRPSAPTFTLYYTKQHLLLHLTSLDSSQTLCPDLTPTPPPPNPRPSPYSPRYSARY